MMTPKQVAAATKRYNNLMDELCREFVTVGTPYAEGTEGWTVRDMVAECDYWLSTYYEDGHMNGDLRYGDAEERKAWRSETAKLQRFIRRYDSMVADMVCKEGHCSSYDNNVRS